MGLLMDNGLFRLLGLRRDRHTRGSRSQKNIKNRKSTVHVAMNTQNAWKYFVAMHTLNAWVYTSSRVCILRLNAAVR